MRRVWTTAWDTTDKGGGTIVHALGRHEREAYGVEQSLYFGSSASGLEIIDGQLSIDRDELEALILDDRRVLEAIPPGGDVLVMYDCEASVESFLRRFPVRAGYSRATDGQIEHAAQFLADLSKWTVELIGKDRRVWVAFYGLFSRYITGSNNGRFIFEQGHAMRRVLEMQDAVRAKLSVDGYKFVPTVCGSLYPQAGYTPKQYNVLVNFMLDLGKRYGAEPLGVWNDRIQPIGTHFEHVPAVQQSQWLDHFGSLGLKNLLFWTGDRTYASGGIDGKNPRYENQATVMRAEIEHRGLSSWQELVKTTRSEVYNVMAAWRDSEEPRPQDEAIPTDDGDQPMPDDDRQPGLTSEPLRYSMPTPSGATIEVSQFTGLAATRSNGENVGLSEYQTGVFRITGSISQEQLDHIEQIEEAVIAFADSVGLQLVNAADTGQFEATYMWLDNPDTEAFDPDQCTIGHSRTSDTSRTIHIVIVDLFDDATPEQQQALNDVYGICVAEVFKLLGIA